MTDAHHAAVDELQNRYILALDNKDWNGWLKAFTADGQYFVQRVAIKSLGDNEYDVLSNFSVFYTSESGESNILAVGKYEDHVLLGPDGARFKKKRAVIDTFLLPRYLVYPI